MASPGGRNFFEMGGGLTGMSVLLTYQPAAAAPIVSAASAGEHGTMFLLLALCHGPFGPRGYIQFSGALSLSLCVLLLSSARNWFSRSSTSSVAHTDTGAAQDAGAHTIGSQPGSRGNATSLTSTSHFLSFLLPALTGRSSIEECYVALRLYQYPLRSTVYIYRCIHFSQPCHSRDLEMEPAQRWWAPAARSDSLSLSIRAASLSAGCFYSRRERERKGSMSWLSAKTADMTEVAKGEAGMSA